MTAQSYPSPEANAWGTGIEYAPSGELGMGGGGSELPTGSLDEIRQELSGIRVGIEGMREDSAAVRQMSADLIEEARQQDEQPPAPIEPPPAPDFYPFAELPMGTIIRDLPDGGKLFIMPDGLVLRTGCENTLVVIDADGVPTPVQVGPGGVVTIAPGRQLQLAPSFLRLTHEAAGIAGLPVDILPVQSAPGRVSVQLPGGTRLDVHRDTMLLAIINTSGAIGVVGTGRIEGIGEPVQVRMLAGGLRSFTFSESGHAGVVEADGTIRLCLASGEDLTISFPAPDPGEDPPPAGGAVCPTCGIKHS